MKNKILSLIITGLLVINLIISLASALTISSVSVPNEIQPGEKATVSFNLENNLDDEVTGVSVSLNLKDLPLAPYKDSNQKSFDKIKQDGLRWMEFDLIANSEAESGTYKIPVDISYNFEGEKKIESGMISLIINALPKISLTSESSGLIKARSNELAIKLVNSGLGDAKFSSVKIGYISGVRVIGSNNFYIGDISKDDFDTVKLNLFVNENAGSLISIPLEISYKDSRNKDYNQEETLTIKAYTEKEAVKLGLAEKSNTGLIVFGIIMVVVLYLVYRWLKKRKKNKIIE